MFSKVLIVDFGSQYTQLIARRVRELNIFCEIFPFNNLPKKIFSFEAIILSGSPFSVKSNDSPTFNLKKFYGKLPILAICYGAQYIAHNFGGIVSASNKREYGRALLSKIKEKDPFFNSVKNKSQVWMSHSDTIQKLPKDFECIASTDDVEFAAFKSLKNILYGIQFHPEVFHSEDGRQIFYNFFIKILKFKQNWTSKSFISETVSNLTSKIKSDKVILGLSGGVDSTVAAVLINKAIGENLNCIFVNNGLLRKNEYTSVLDYYKKIGLKVKGVDASDLFYKELKGVVDPEMKRKIIGKIFIDVFQNESKLICNANWLGQGTIYPDVIESISVNGPSATIKSHHNVGGIPSDMKLKIIEPLKMLFKDEVRKVGLNLKIDKNIINRHPFPGPGLAIRILGEVTKEKVELLQDVDDIFISELKRNNLYKKIWQAGAILLPVNTVGVMGDERTYESCVALRAVTSTDGMTADWVDLPYKILQKISNEIINKVKGVNRVVYDISSKPPATIEWE